MNTIVGEKCDGVNTWIDVNLQSAFAVVCGACIFAVGLICLRISRVDVTAASCFVSPC